MRRAWTTLLLGAVLALLVACQSPAPATEDQPTNAENKAEMVRVVEKARTLPDVLDAKGNYSTSLTTDGKTGISVTVPEATAEPRLEQLMDEMERLLWTSTIRPFTSLSVVVLGPAPDPTQPPKAGRSYPLDQLAQLDTKFGPRPGG